MKNCKKEGCANPAQSHGYCFRHGYLRTDSKKPKRPQFKKQELKTTHKIDFGFDNQTEMFFYIWDNAKDERGNVICPYTGERLNQFYGKDIWFSCFAHLLPKGKYTYFKLNPTNIRIVFPMFHVSVDMGTLDARKQHPGWKYELWDREVLRMKEEYRQFKIKNLLA